MSFIQKQLYPIPFTGGIDTKTDPKQVLAGNLLTLENGEFTKKGQINKRAGYDLLTRNIAGGGTIASAQAIDNFDKELLLFDGTSVYSYIQSTSNWINRGVAISVITNDKHIIRTSAAQQLNPDVAYCNGTEVYVWEDSRGGVRYSALDTVTQSFAVADGVINSGVFSKPKCVIFQNLIYVFYTDALNNIYYQTINPLNPTLLTTQTLVASDGYTALGYDVAVIGTAMFVGYLSGSVASGQISLLKYDNLLTKTTTVIENTAGNAINVGFNSVLNVAGDSSNNVWVSWADGIHIRTSCVSFTLVPILADTIVDTVRVNQITGIESTTPGVLQLTYEVYNATPSNTLIKSKTITQGGVLTSVATLRSVGLASKAFKVNSNIYVNCAFQSTLQSTYFTIRINSAPFLIISKANSQVGGGLRTNNMLSEVPVGNDPDSDNDVYIYANLVKGKVLSEANTIFFILGVNSTKLDFENLSKFISITQSNNLLIVGGALQCYDGVSVVEMGFHIYPESVTANAAGADGYLSSGTYQYQVCYEWSDNFGQIQRSAPSPAISVSVSLNNHVTLTIPTLRLTSKQGPRTAPSIVIYRTQANGITFNQITSTIAPLNNDLTVDTVQFVDVASDVTISSNALIYTSGDILSNQAPPANSLIALFQNRVIISGLEDPNLLWYSQNKFDGTDFNTIPCEFAAELTLGVDPRGGKITALGVLNNNLIIFKQSQIYTVSGDGPNASGLGNVFPDPQQIVSDTGCNNPNSVVLTPRGLIFQSDKGIYLLDQSLNLDYIGARVEQYNDSVITSSTLIPDKNQVIFTIANGPALIYDYYFNQWGTWTNHFPQDAIIFQNLYCWVNATGIISQQNLVKFTDGGTPVYLSWTTPNLSFAGLNGYQQVFRVFLLGTYKGQHTLNVQVAYDFDDVYTQSVAVNASKGITVWGGDATWGLSSPWGSAYVPYEFRIDFKTQKCTSIRLKISDNQSSDYNEGYSISALTFDVGVLPDGNRLPSTQTYGTQ